MPKRSPEITDAVMALLIGAMFALVKGKTRRNSAAVKEPQRRPHIVAFGYRAADSPILPVRVRNVKTLSCKDKAARPNSRRPSGSEG